MSITHTCVIKKILIIKNKMNVFFIYISVLVSVSSSVSQLVTAEQIKSLGCLCLSLLVKYSVHAFVELRNSCIIWHLQLLLFLVFHSHDVWKVLFNIGKWWKRKWGSLEPVLPRLVCHLAGLFLRFAGPCSGTPASMPHSSTELSTPLAGKSSSSTLILTGH